VHVQLQLQPRVFKVRHTAAVSQRALRFTWSAASSPRQGVPRFEFEIGCLFRKGDDKNMTGTDLVPILLDNQIVAV
jgi:hypothetical protein